MTKRCQLNILRHSNYTTNGLPNEYEPVRGGLVADTC
ncbi:hypothetical protein EYZ11_008776 [Aspergillus tanneri]|uniref:Uncharacterized protein n=1 Tax=Aspergillus tanneri TaxID=1220188 RepID=A0A4S3J9M0_9EURO|nr:hypothetical protein EYZ11_008776 [Aspergillus tanneri]